ncbi:MAG: hypothetical protein SYC29_09980 [Planctomycetota bacterium]|nr:hypothetical protein [Planctomycetota bacterium]
MMKKLTPVLIGLLAAGLLASPAAGQSLSDRIAAVRARHAREQAEKARLDQKTKILQALLYEKLTVQFDGTPARDVFDYLRTILDINVIVRYSDDPVGHGIDPQSPITLDVAEMPAVDVLELVLEQCAAAGDCTWQVRGSFLEVGTKERLSVAGAREMRVYPIGDLLHEAPRFVDAPPIGFSDQRWYPWGPYGGYGSYGGYGGSIHGGGRIYPSTGSYRRPGGYTQGPVTEDPNTPEKKAQRGQEIIELIVASIEPMAWADNGGNWATIRYRDEALVISAPDYIHRQINGYGPVPPPAEQPAKPIPSRPAKRDDGDGGKSARPAGAAGDEDGS